MKNNVSLKTITMFVISGILISYIMQMGPSPLLMILRDEFSLNGKDALLNLCVSIIFPFLIIGSISGSYIEKKLGTERLFTIVLALLTTGLVGNYFVTDVTSFLIFRSIFGIGFGLGIPFIGSVIMKWYNPKQREYMTTVNGLFPFIATLISFCSMLPLYYITGDSWRACFGLWGILTGLILILWMSSSHKITNTKVNNITEDDSESNLYSFLLKLKPIRQLALIFMSDFFCYSYIATVLPTWLFELGGVSQTTANILAAAAFPLVGLLGCSVGGIYSTKTGQRKPPLVIGQALKLAGLIIASITSNLYITLIGIILFAFGNGVWMPSMYSIPTELDGMNSSKVGAAFALISALGFVCGFISPVFGGWLSGLLSSNIEADLMLMHIMGMRLSVFIFSFLCLGALIVAVRIKETGKMHSAR